MKLHPRMLLEPGFDSRRGMSRGVVDNDVQVLVSVTALQAV